MFFENEKGLPGDIGEPGEDGRIGMFQSWPDETMNFTYDESANFFLTNMDKKLTDCKW